MFDLISDLPPHRPTFIQLCRVSRQFQSLATPFLYAWLQVENWDDCNSDYNDQWHYTCRMRDRMYPWRRSPESAAFVKYLVVLCPYGGEVHEDLLSLLTPEFCQCMTRLRAVHFSSFYAPVELISNILSLPSLQVWESGDSFNLNGDPAAIQFDPETSGLTHVRMDISGQLSDADLEAVTKITHSPRLRTLQMSNGWYKDESLLKYLQDPPPTSFKSLTKLTCRLPTNDLGLLHRFVDHCPNVTHLALKRPETKDNNPPLIPCPANALQQLRALYCPIDVAGVFTPGRPIEDLKLECKVISGDVIVTALGGSSMDVYNLKHVEFHFHYSVDLCSLTCIGEVLPTLERLTIRSLHGSRSRVSYPTNLKYNSHC